VGRYLGKFVSTGENQKLKAIAERDGSEPLIPLGNRFSEQILKA
jgi:hypothetical protein